MDAAIASFIAMMNKAYACGMEKQFQQIQEIFLDEVDTLIDDKRLAAQNDECIFPHLLEIAKKKE